MLQIFVGIPYIFRALLLARLSAIYSRFSGSYLKPVESLYCKLLLRVKHYIGFGLDEAVIEIMRREPDRHVVALIDLLDNSSREYADLAFSTLNIYFSDDNTRRALVRFINNLASEEEKSRYRSRMQ